MAIEEWKTLPLPLRLRMGGEFIPLSQWLTGDYHPGATLSSYEGASAQLCLDETPLVNVRIDRKEGGGLSLVPCEGTWLVPSEDMEALCSGLQVTLAVRMGHGLIPLQELSRLQPDSLHPLAREDDSWEARLYLPEFDLELARGEVLTVGDSFGLRITALAIQAPRYRSSRIPALSYACEMGRNQFALADILKLEEGSLLEMDKPAVGPVDMVLENGSRFDAFPLYQKGQLYLWIPPRPGKAPGPEEGTGKVSRGSWEEWQKLVREIPGSLLLPMLQDETPLWGALVLAALPSREAARLVEGVDEGSQEPLVAALTQGDPSRIPSGVWRILCDDLLELTDHPLVRAPGEAGAHDAARGLLAELPRDLSGKLLEKFFAEEPEAEEEIKAELHTFDDLPELPDKDFQVLLEELDEDMVVKAMLGSSKAFAEKVYANIPPDVGATLKEDLSYVGSIPESAIIKARDTVLQTFIALHRDGKVPVA